MKKAIFDGIEYVLIPKDEYILTDDNEMEKDNLHYGCTTEDDNHCFEFSVLVDDEDGELVAKEMQSVTWTFKSGGSTECWDNPDWLIKVAQAGNKGEIDEFPKVIDEKGFKLVRKMLKKMIKLNWL